MVIGLRSILCYVVGQGQQNGGVVLDSIISAWYTVWSHLPLFCVGWWLVYTCFHQKVWRQLIFGHFASNRCEMLPILSYWYIQPLHCKVYWNCSTFGAITWVQQGQHCKWAPHRCYHHCTHLQLAGHWDCNIGICMHLDWASLCCNHFCIFYQFIGLHMEFGHFILISKIIY